MKMAFKRVTARKQEMSMKKGTISALAISVALASTFGSVGAVQAETLKEAMASAYSTNPQLKAQRASLRASDESVSRARAGYRPTLSGSVTDSRSKTSNSSSAVDPDTGAIIQTDTSTSRSMSLTARQSIFSGFSTKSANAQAQFQVKSGRASLQSAEQNVFLDTVTAYMDVLRDQAVLELNENQIQVLERQLQASRDRFRVGEITRTDVAQSEARLERSKSNRLQSVAALAGSRAKYQRVVGSMPAGLSQPKNLPALPSSIDQALDLARNGSPSVAAARFNEMAAQQGIKQAKSALYPSLGLQASVSRSDWTRGPIEGVANTTKSIGLQLSVPLYSGGAEYSDIRRAKALRSQRMLEIEQAERLAIENAFVTWDNMKAASAQIMSSNAQVRANEIALEGVRQEAAVGSRTTLDVLNADQELLDSRVNLIRSQRNEFVAAYQLLASLGQLTAKDLNLDVTVYDPKKNADAVKNKLIGF